MHKVLRAGALLGMFVGVSGCFAWQTVGALPRTADLPMETRITKFDGSTVILATSRIENDTIKGYQAGNTVRQVIPLAHVDLIESKKLQPKESIIGGTVAAVVLYFIFKAVVNSQPFGPIEGVP